MKEGEKINTRIRKLREELKLNQEEFANALGLNRNFISLIEVGKRNPSGRTISSICDRFNVNEEWMQYGTGDIFREDEPTIMQQLQKEFNLDDFSYSLVYEYLKLSDNQKKAVQDFFYKVIKKRNS